MTQQHSFSARAAKARFVPGNRTSAAYAPQTPWRNHLLAALPEEECDRLRPDLASVVLPSGSTVHAAGDRERHLYFITSGIVSRVCTTRDGVSTGFALTGSEGVIGVASFLGGGSTPNQAVALSTVCAYRLETDRLKDEIERVGPLTQLLLHYTLALLAQTAQIAVCNRHHSLEQRLCRLILSCLDRLRSNQLSMTHEMISHLLGVRREGVTEASLRLQREGLIHCDRGHLSVLDRPRLELRACECYAVVKREYDRLLPGNQPTATPCF